ncbi:MAG: methylmalonyl-CoA epimerase [Chloroflexi bacterium]|nr:methylmalonyl-CoA epimerase [Chloroflexota bacterium]
MSEQAEQAPCAARHINHVCIAVSDIEDTLKFYRDLFGVGNAEIEDLPDQGVRAALVRVGGSQLEFIQPTDTTGGVARFIERRGEGVHHIAFEVENLQAKLDDLAARGVELIDKSPREGLSGDIAFLHPRATRGVLIELVDQDTARR